MKIVTWNINGIRSGWERLLELIESENPDIICLQEIKIDDTRLTAEHKNIKGYESYWFHAEKAGYSGTAIFSKIKADEIILGMGIDKFDREGRTVTLKIKDFSLVNFYFPHSGRSLERLPFKLEFNVAARDFVSKLNSKKVALCGDFNVAHTEIDLARPKDNVKNAGFTPIEREWFDELLKDGWCDVFRDLYPTKQEYTWWSQRSGARLRNIGWRIDYFLVNQDMKKTIKDCRIKREAMGSDHAPVILTLKND